MAVIRRYKGVLWPLSMLHTSQRLSGNLCVINLLIGHAKLENKCWLSTHSDCLGFWVVYYLQIYVLKLIWVSTWRWLVGSHWDFPCQMLFYVHFSCLQNCSCCFIISPSVVLDFHCMLCCIVLHVSIHYHHFAQLHYTNWFNFFLSTFIHGL